LITEVEGYKVVIINAFNGRKRPEGAIKVWLGLFTHLTFSNRKKSLGLVGI
jgi:hypothetical protein